jgi:carbon monoxide dehydrogenase subunit G
MPTIRTEIALAVDADAAWDAVRDVGAVHRRLAPGFVTDVKLEEGARIVTFGNGLVVRERLIDIDDAARRLAYSATGGRAEHHNASIEVLPDGPGRCRVRWITDVLPEAVAGLVGGMIEQGTEAMRRTLERGARS